MVKIAGHGLHVLRRLCVGREVVWCPQPQHCRHFLRAHYIAGLISDPKEVKIARIGKDSFAVHEPIYWALPNVPDSERKESE